MANREQRRKGQKLMKRPELKGYVDKFCMDISSILIDHCELAKQQADATGSQIDFQSVQAKVEEVLKLKGTELGSKVQEIVKSQKMSATKNVVPKANIKRGAYN